MNSIPSEIEMRHGYGNTEKGVPHLHVFRAHKISFHELSTCRKRTTVDCARKMKAEQRQRNKMKQRMRSNESH